MDYPYVINFFFMLFLGFLYWKKPDRRLVFFAFIWQFVFIAFRAPVVGADTWDYIRFLDGERNFYNYDERELEPAFLVYRELLVELNCDRFFCMFITYAFACFPLFVLIRHFSRNAPLSLAMLPILNFYYLYFCGLRQIMALSILIMAMLYVIEIRKKKWYVFGACSVLAWLFHTSAVLYVVIFLIAYFIKIKSRMLLISSVVVSAILGVVLQIFNVFDAFELFLQLNFGATERLVDYFDNDEDINQVESIMMSLRPSSIAVFIFLFIDKRRLSNWFTVIYAIGIVLSNLFVSVPMVNRFTVGLNMFGVVVFTWIFSREYYTSYKLRHLLNKILVVFFLYFGQILVKNNLYSNIDFYSSDRMHPYYFFWENYNNHPSIRYW